LFASLALLASEADTAPLTVEKTSFAARAEAFAPVEAMRASRPAAA
jgi:hypothetical protein